MAGDAVRPRRPRRGAARNQRQGERKETGPTGADRIAFLGFGEAAQAFLQGWRTQPDFGARIVAYDVKTDSPDARARDAKRADYAAAGVEDGKSAPTALSGAPLVFSVVTADQAEHAALAALPGLADDALFFDCNSCAPQTKARSAERIEAAGGRYVDVAVMSP